MRKHKSVVAILLAVMMIFTFMPTMAFAGTGTQGASYWKDNYAKVVDVNDEEFDADRYFDGGVTTGNILPVNFNGPTGLITAVPKDKTGAVGSTVVPAPNSDAVYYDLSGAKLVYGVRDGQNYTYKALDGTTWTQDAFNAAFRQSASNYRIFVELVEPDYTLAAKTAKEAGETYKPKKAYIQLDLAFDGDTMIGSSGTNLKDWTLTLKEADYDYDSKKEQDVKFEVDTILPNAGTITDGMHNADVVNANSIAPATVKVEAPTIAPQNAGFYLDEVGTALDGVVYDGKTHTVVADATPGWNVSYMVRNPETGKYEAKDSVTISEVQKTAVSFYAIFKDVKGKKADVTSATQSVNLKSLNDASVPANRDVYIGFDVKASEQDTDCYYTVPGETYDASEYLTFVAEEVSTEVTTDAKIKERIRKANDNAKNAVSTNAALLKDWFNDYKKIKDVTTKAEANNGIVKLQIVDKELTADEIKALNKKYAGLFRNLGALNATDINKITSTTATIKLNGALKDYEIEFTNTPTSKVYKGKKTTKAGKLKKDQSFTVTAVSNNGKTVAYKLVNANTPKISIDKNTGKVTVKKGAKGTYKIKVKAYVPGSSLTLFETQAITIKIKK